MVKTRSSATPLCSDCGPLHHSANDSSGSGTVVHVCLQCGQWRCAAHAAAHAGKLLKKHPVVCVAGSWTVHCYACGVDTDAATRGEGSIRDCVHLVNGTADEPRSRSTAAHNDDGDDDDDDGDVPPPVVVAKAGAGPSPEISNDQLRAQLAKIDFAALGAGLCGLQNLGNTCFFNSVLQCLFQTPRLRATFLRPLFRPEPQLTRAFHSLLLQVWSKRSVVTVSPHALLAEVIRKAPQFRGGRQQDAHELLRCLLDAMQEEELVRVKALQAALATRDELDPERRAKVDVAAQSTDNVVRDTFGGQLQSTVTCLTCLFPSVTGELFYDLGLSVGPAAVAAPPRAAASAAARAPAVRRPRQMTKKQLKRHEKLKRQGAASAANHASAAAAADDDADDDEAGDDVGDEAAAPGDADDEHAASLLLYYETLMVAPASAAEPAPAPVAELDAAAAERAVRELDQRRAPVASGAFPSDSVQHALATFTAPELLADAYFCEQCDERRRAVRQACVQRAPETLTLCLKRFRTSIVGKSLEMTKFGGHVDFPARLDLAQFCTAECGGSLAYTLSSVVVHSGGNTKSGHYVAYTRTTQGWYYLSDSVCRASSLSDALASQAYLLFYQRDDAPPSEP